MHPKDKIPTQLHQDVVYQWNYSNEKCNSSYIGESSRYLERGVKEHSTSSTSSISQHCTVLKNLKASIFKFKVIDQDRKQVSREAIHMRRNNPALNQNIGKLNIPKIFNQILGLTHSTSADVSTNPNAQQKPSSNHSYMVPRATNLHN